VTAAEADAMNRAIDREIDEHRAGRKIDAALRGSVFRVAERRARRTMRAELTDDLRQVLDRWSKRLH